MKTKSLVIITALFALPAVLAVVGQSAPQLINYQGRLTNPASQLLDGVTVDIILDF